MGSLGRDLRVCALASMLDAFFGRLELQEVGRPQTRSLREFETAQKTRLLSGILVFTVLVSGILSSSTPQLPFKIRQIPSNRDHKALNRAGLGYYLQAQEVYDTSAPGVAQRPRIASLRDYEALKRGTL